MERPFTSYEEAEGPMGDSRGSTGPSEHPGASPVRGLPSCAKVLLSSPRPHPLFTLQAGECEGNRSSQQWGEDLGDRVILAPTANPGSWIKGTPELPQGKIRSRPPPNLTLTELKVRSWKSFKAKKLMSSLKPKGEVQSLHREDSSRRRSKEESTQVGVQSLRPPCSSSSEILAATICFLL